MVFELKVGQVIVFRGDKLSNRLIQMGMGNYWSHVGWIVTADNKYVYIQEAKAGKNRVVTTRFSRHELHAKYDANLIKVLDFKIKSNSAFYNVVRKNNQKKYDHVANLTHLIQRILRLLGKKELDLNYTTESFVNCSEMIARSLYVLKNYPILELLNKKRFDQIKPQGIVLLHDKLEDNGLL